MKPQGSSAGHNGLKSIEAVLGSQGYLRLALGVGRPDRADEVVDHVLGGLSAEEEEAVATLLNWAVPLANSSWTDRWETLIHAFNQRDRHPSSNP
jgi:PTH1 family peptidyl-tRNA hydrolase